MKISVAVSILILVVGAVIGRHDRQQLAALRTTQEHLIAKAEKLGVSSDPAQVTKRERPTRAAIAKLSISEVLEIAKEIQRLNTPDGQNYQAIGALNWRILDGLSAWDLTELKALLAEIRTNPDLNRADPRYPQLILLHRSRLRSPAGCAWDFHQLTGTFHGRQSHELRLHGARHLGEK